LQHAQLLTIGVLMGLQEYPHIVNILGGFNDWSAKQLPVEK
jgi:hypothetical protein